MHGGLIFLSIIGLAGSPPAAKSRPSGNELLIKIEIAGSAAPARMATLSLRVPLENVPQSWRSAPLVAGIRDPGRGVRPAAASLVRKDPGPRHFVLLEWIEPRTAAGEVRRCVATVRPAEATEEKAFRIQDTPDGILCTENGRPVFQVMSAFDPDDLENTKKVYHHLWDPSGGTLLTKGPGGKYSHHRGLFLGWKETRIGDRVWDSWHMPNGDNTQRQSAAERSVDPARASLLSRIDWYDGDRVYIREQRAVTAYPAAREGRLLDVRTSLETADGIERPVRLDGDLQHAGFHFRASDEVAAENESLTEFVFPSVDGPPGTFVRLAYPDDSMMGKDPRWGCMLFTVGENRFGVFYASHPAAKRPAEFSIRHYGRFGEFFPWLLKPGEPLSMAYRLFVFEGERDPETLEAVYQGLAHPPAVKLLGARWAPN